jgi:uncharacterized protein
MLGLQNLSLKIANHMACDVECARMLRERSGGGPPPGLTSLGHPPPAGEGFPRPLAIAVLIAFLSSFIPAPARALEFPALTGRVVDEANVLDSAQRAALTDKLAALEAKTTDQLVVVTLKSLQGTSIEDFGVQLGRHWQIGQKDKNNGVLLIVAPSERKVRVEVGYGLEGTLTDAMSSVIIQTAIIPRFKANDFAGGIGRGVDGIIDVLTGDDAEWKARAAQRPDAAPDWGGLLTWILVIALILFIFWTIRGASSTPPSRRSRGSSGPWIIPGGSWSSGSGGFGGGFSGGGFSGGGGSFGGGGSSGSW